MDNFHYFGLRNAGVNILPVITSWVTRRKNNRSHLRSYWTGDNGRWWHDNYIAHHMTLKNINLNMVNILLPRELKRNRCHLVGEREFQVGVGELVNFPFSSVERFPL